MSKVKVFDLLKEVEYNRKSLIKHCNENGINVSPNASLSSVVGANNIINNPKIADNNKAWVKFLDIDGSILEEYTVDKGSQMPTCSVEPNYDPEYLEFKYWQYDSEDLETVQRNTLFGPIYQVKADEDGKRWTHIFIDVPENTEIKLQFGQDTSNSIAYIDWGDASEILTSTGTTNPAHIHTYLNAGKYVIKIYSDTKYFFREAAVLGSNTNNAFITKIYLGDNFRSLYRYCLIESSLKAFVFSPDTECTIQGSSSNSTQVGTFAYVQTLKFICMPDCVNKFNGQNSFTYTYGLEYILFSRSITTMSFTSGLFIGCYNLRHIAIVNWIVTSYGWFGSCYNLENAFINLNESTGYFSTGSMSYRVITFSSNYKLNLSSINFMDGSDFTFSGYNDQLDVTRYTGDKMVIQSSYTKALSIPKSVDYLNISSCMQLKSLSIENPNLIQLSLSNLYALTDLVLPNDFNLTLTLTSLLNLTKESIINIANKVIDLTGMTSKTIKFNRSIYYMLNNEIDSYTNKPLIQLFTEKNWTVSFDDLY